MLRLLLAVCLTLGVRVSDQSPQAPVVVTIVERPPNTGAVDESVVYQNSNPHAPQSKKTFVLNVNFKVNWFQSMLLCHSMNMKFATVGTEEEYTQLISVIKQANLMDASFWLSASDLGDTGTYMWASYGTPMNFSRWRPGDPNHDKRDNQVEHCIEISSNIGYQMNDDICINKKFAVCEHFGLKRDSTEYEILNPSSPSREKHFYLNIITKVNWYQALHLCHAMNMKFGTVNNQQDYDKLVDMMKKANVGQQAFWMSGSDLGDRGTFMWASYGRPMTFTKWLAGDPNHVLRNGEVEHCVDISWFVNYQMIDEPCSHHKFSVCEYYT